MGANFHFDKMLPTVTTEAVGSNPMRQTELFTYGGSLFLRIGPPNKENFGSERYTVEIDKENAFELASMLQLLAE